VVVIVVMEVAVAMAVVIVVMVLAGSYSGGGERGNKFSAWIHLLDEPEQPCLLDAVD
jgi:hypothetical protein